MAKHSHRSQDPSRVRHRSHRVTFMQRLATSALSDIWIYCAVFIGGFVGTFMRYIFSIALNPRSSVATMHWGTFSANILACFLYAFISALIASIVAEHWTDQAKRRAEIIHRGFVIGLCGALSTMSTFIMELLPHSIVSIYYAIASVACGIVAIIIGGIIGEKLGQKIIQNSARTMRSSLSVSQRTFNKNSTASRKKRRH